MSFLDEMAGLEGLRIPGGCDDCSAYQTVDASQGSHLPGQRPPRRHLPRLPGDARGERMTAAEVFGQALLEIAEQGRATPCQGRRRDRWTSDRAEERLWAASVCVGLGCAVLLQCRAVADEQGEKFGVWAGRDRTPPQPSRTRSRAADA